MPCNQQQIQNELLNNIYSVITIYYSINSFVTVLRGAVHNLAAIKS